MYIFFNLQLKRNLAVFQHTTGAPTLESVFQQWRNFCEKPPKGFEKYFKPKDGAKKGRAPKRENESKGAPSSQQPPKPSSSPSRPSQKDNWPFGMFGNTA